MLPRQDFGEHMTTLNDMLREITEQFFPAPKTWKDVVPDCVCGPENNYFCDACLQWYINVAY